MKSNAKMGVKVASGQARFKLLTSTAMVAMALASMSAEAGTGRVCLDGVTPPASCTAGTIGTYYANSPTLRKFVDTIAGLTSANPNKFASGAPGEYISIAEPDVASYPGSEYFVIGVVEHKQRMHSDLQNDTTQRSYVQLYPPLSERGANATNPPTPAASAYATFGAPNPGAAVALTYPNGDPIVWPDPVTGKVKKDAAGKPIGEQVYAYDKAHYLGPIIITKKGTPVRVKFVNFLPNGSATIDTVLNANGSKNVLARNGDMFLPTDQSLAGVQKDNGTSTSEYPQNRVAFHLHGGDSPWISDGTPHQWIAATGENSPNQHGDRFMNAPDMPYPGDGAQNTFWPNDQSNRLMWYHDHTFGLTRQNAYSGAAAGYVIYDDAELALLTGNGLGVTKKAIPNGLLDQVVLVIQDKTWVPNDIATQDSKWDINAWGKPGDLWYPHVYEPIQLWDTNAINSVPYYTTTATVTTTTLVTDSSGATVTDTSSVVGPTTATSAFVTAPLIGVTMSTSTPTVDAAGNTTTVSVTTDISAVAPATAADTALAQVNSAVTNPAGRWDYAVDDATLGYRVPNAPLRNDPDYGQVAFPDGTYFGGPSATPESYMDTPVVNGIAYPVLNVDPKAYRVRFLNGANDRYWNLSLWVADPGQTASDGRTNTEVKMVPELVPSAIAVTNGGLGYVNPQVTIVDKVTLAGGSTVIDGTGRGATATATVDAYGAITAIRLVNSGSGYVNPQVVITDANRVAGSTVDAVVSLSTVAGRDGGIPDPAFAGPNVIRFANEGGLLAAPVVHKPTPMTGFMDPQAGFTLARDSGGDFYLGGAERADTVIDFSQFAGKTLIVYNDSSAPVPGGDARYDYYTNGPDQTPFGGAPSTLAGFGPNTRTVMQIRVAATLAGATTKPAQRDAYEWDPVNNLPLPGGALSTELPIAFAASTDARILTAGTPATPDTAAVVASLTLPTAVNSADVGLIVNGLPSPTMTLKGEKIPLKVKTIRGITDPNFGRLIAQIGIELPQGDPLGTPLAYVDTPTDIIGDNETQYWWIKNNDVDNHPMHFHLFNVQVVARVDQLTGTILPPQPDETGWKETLKNWPLEDVIVAIKPKTPALPFGLPKSVRNLDPTLPTGASNSSFNRPGVDLVSAFLQTDLVTGAALTTPLVNISQDFDWEYVWHCHILGHEENDLMRPLVFHPAPPTVPATLPGSVAVDATGKVTWTDPTPALDAATKGNTDNEIGFSVERAVVTTTNATGTPTTGTFAALAPNAPVVDGRVNTLANATSFQDAPAKFTDYAYQVVSVNEGGVAVSLPFTLAQAPATPTGISVDATGKVTWTDASSNETGFRVEKAQVSTDSGAAVAGSFVQVANLAANTTSFKDVPLANTDYQYRVFAVNVAATPADSAASALFSLSTLPAPATSISVDAAGVVTWIDNASNETGYFVERATVTTSTTGVPTVGAWTKISPATNLTANTTTFAGPALAPNTDYQYRVTAVNAKGQTNALFGLSATTPSAVPSAPSITSTGAVTWAPSPTPSVTGYDVYRATVTSGGLVSAFARVGSTTGALTTSFNDTLTANTDYQYQVVALKGTVASAASPTGVLTQAPTAATGLAAVVTAATATTPASAALTWVDNSSNEESFSVEGSTDNGVSWTALGATPITVAANAVTTSVPVTPGLSYIFRVSAVKTGFPAAYAQTAATPVPALLLAPVISVAATLTATGPQASLSWPDVSIGETGFTVERCAGTTAQCALATANWIMLQGATSPVGHLPGGAVNYVDTTLATGATYVYRVKAVAGATVGPVGTSVQVSTPIAMVAPAAPTLSSPTGAGVTVSWIDNSTNETGFLVERSNDNLNFAPLLPAVAAGAAAPTATVTSTTAQKSATGRTVTYSDATAVAGTVYYYRVRSVNVSGTTVSSSAPSASTSIQLAMPAPTALTAVQSGANIVLTWTDTSATETSFEVKRADSLGAVTLFSVARTAAQTASVNTAVTYSDVTAIPGTVYTYTVRAVNTPLVVAPATYSAATAAATASVVIPQPTSLSTSLPPATATGAPGTGVILNWVDNATFESGYRIDRAIVSLDSQGNVPVGTVYTTLVTQARTGNLVRTTGAAAYTDLTATTLTAPQVYAYQVYAVKTTAVPAATVGGVATTVTSYSAPSNEAHTGAAAAVTGAPTGLTAVTSSGTSIVLSWIDSSTNETSFQVSRTDPLGVTVTFATPARSTTLTTAVGARVSYTDATAVVGTLYTYSVAAVTSAAGVLPPVLGPSSTPVTASLTVNAPSNATAAQTATGITIGWTDNSNNEIGFQIMRTGVDAAGVPILPVTFNVTSTATQKTATGTARTYIDTTAVPGVTYSYTVAATSGTAALPIPGTAISTSPVTITETIAAPSTPTAVITSASRITVTWTDLSTNETGFLVERLLTPTVAGATAPAWTTLATVARTGTATTGVNGAVSYVDNLVAPATQGTYQYRVSAVNVTGTKTNAASTAVASNTLDFIVPAAPTVLTVTPGAVGSGAVTLGWVDNANNETGYTIQRATNATFTTGLVTTAVPGAITVSPASYTLNGMTKGTKYFFRVAATNAAGTSAYVASTVAVAVP